MASIVWDFFTVSEEDISCAICTKCSANIPRGGKKTSSFNTSNLISHLKRQHRYDGVLKAYEDACAAKEAAPKPAAKKGPGLFPIAAAFEKCKKFARDDPRAKAICDFIMEMMALDDQPFTIIEDTGFCRLVNHLEPRFVLPSCRYFSDVCLPAKYDVIATLLHTLIDGNKDISFTTDLWTCDVSPVSLLGTWMIPIFIVGINGQIYRYSLLNPSLFESFFPPGVPKLQLNLNLKNNKYK